MDPRTTRFALAALVCTVTLGAAPAPALAPVGLSPDETGKEIFERRRSTWHRGVFLGPEALAELEMEHAVDFFDGVDGTVVTWRFGVDEMATPRKLPRVRNFVGNGCFRYLVDGVPLRLGDAPRNPWGVAPLLFLTPDRIRGVEVYHGVVDVPDEIRRWAVRRRGSLGGGPGERALCGLVVIWTAEAWSTPQ